MDLDVVLMALAAWVLGSVPVSLAVAGRIRGVDVRERRTHRGARPVRAHRVARSPREFRAAGETRSLAQLRTRLTFSGLDQTRTARTVRAPRGRRRLGREQIKAVA